MLSIRLRDKKSPIEIHKNDKSDVIVEAAILSSGDRFRDIVFISPRGAKRISVIEENPSKEILVDYLSAYATYGESFFLFAEIVGTRDCVPEYIESSGISYESIAECGFAIADRYLGIPDGAMKYMDGLRLCQDVMAGRGPDEIGGRVRVVQAMDFDMVFLFDMGEAEHPNPEDRLSGGPR